MKEEKKEIIKKLQEKAVRYFCDKPNNFLIGRPYNCCESILLALAEFLDPNSKIIPKIGTAIGAGVSLNGLLCGSVSSVALAIGIKFGRNNNQENPQLVWDIMDGYVAIFKDKLGAVNCRQLTGLDMKTKEGLKEYFERVHDYECTERLKFAVEKAIEILLK